MMRARSGAFTPAQVLYRPRPVHPCDTDADCPRKRAAHQAVRAARAARRGTAEAHP